MAGCGVGRRLPVSARSQRDAPDGVMVISGVWKQVEGVAYPVG